jgi:hypothetical protein
MADHGQVITFNARAAPVGARGLSRDYENLVVVYLVTLLFLYPYGIAVTADASIKFPDVVGLLCIVFGVAILMLKPRVRLDLLFLAVVGPFVLLEVVYPVIGAAAYRRVADAVSSVRMAVLWLPVILLPMLAAPGALARFERRLRLAFATALWLNVPYAMVLIAVDIGFLPKWMAFTQYLEPWAVVSYFEVVDGLRPAGFFASTIALSVFAVVCLCYFYASYIATRDSADLYHSLGAAFLVLLTTTRVAFIAAALIFFIGWFVLTPRRKFVVLSLGIAALAAVLVLVEQTIGIGQAFHRFTRLAESGLLADVSFGGRVTKTWPAALAVAGNYPLGTLISAPRVTEMIDSGYLNYYIQGRWAFVACVGLMLAGQLAIGFWCLRRAQALTGGLMLLFLSFYLALAMVVTNPMRSPVVIAFVVFAFWKLKSGLESRHVRVAPRIAEPQ